jgi:hypothetical protein
MEIKYNFTFPLSNQSCFDFSYDSEHDLLNNWNSEDSYSLNNLTKSLNNDIGSTYGEEGSVDISTINEIITQESSNPSKEESLEDKVKQEINEKGIDFALNLCLKTKNSDKKKAVKKLRNKQTKTKEQIEKLEEELRRNPHRWTKQERTRISTEIGLTQIQVYKWYYDNTVGTLKSNGDDVITSDDSHKIQKTEE